MAIIAILATLLFPVLRSARQYARRAVCISNLKQIAYATQMWADDNDQMLPPAPGTATSTGANVGAFAYATDYMTARDPILHCPSETRPGLSYSINPHPMGKSLAEVGTGTIWAGDGYVDPNGGCQSLFNQSPNHAVQALGEVSYRHSNTAVFLYCGGHVAARVSGKVMPADWH